MDNTSLYESLRNFDNKYDLLKLGRPVLFRNEYLEFIHNIITKDEFWKKWLEDNNIDFFKQILEPDYMSTYDSFREFEKYCDEEDIIKVKRNTPQTPDDAIRNQDLQYHQTEEIMGPGDQYNELSFLLEIFSERFVDLLRHVIAYNIKEEVKIAIKEEVKIAKQKGEKSTDLLEKLKELEKFENLTKEERSKLYILSELCKRIPSLDASKHLDLTELGECIREGFNTPKLLPCNYFNAGRAYERAIHMQFQPHLKTEFYRMLKQKASQINKASKNPKNIQIWKHYKEQKELYPKRPDREIASKFFNKNKILKTFKNVQTYIQRGKRYSKEISQNKYLKQALIAMDTDLEVYPLI